MTNLRMSVKGVKARPLTIFAGKESQLAEAVEQMKAIVLDARKDLRFRAARQSEMFEVAFEGAGVVEAAGWVVAAKESVVVEHGVVHDEIHHLGAAAIFKGVHHRAVNKIRVVGVAEFEGDDAGGIAAQIALAFGAEFAAHVGGERLPPATAA